MVVITCSTLFGYMQLTSLNLCNLCEQERHEDIQALLVRDTQEALESNTCTFYLKRIMQNPLDII